MTARTTLGASTAFEVAERIRGIAATPWDVFGERVHRYEIHLNGHEIEMIRGPIVLEGFGVRLFRPAGERLGIGTGASSDLSPEGVARTVRGAEATAPFARSPAKSVTLPSEHPSPPATPEIVDHRLWADPMGHTKSYVETLLAALSNRPGVVPSFGSVRVTLAEATYANSSGAHHGYAHTLADLEIAVKSFGGAEGAAPGEYWVNRRTRQLDASGLANEANDWCRRAIDVRRAKAPPTGEQTVVFPTSVMADVIPSILGFRLSGTAAVRKMTVPNGSEIAHASVTVHDDGRLPHGLGSAPFDDEGIPQGRRTLIDAGKMAGLVQDLVHASALGAEPTGNGRRDSIDFAPWFHFTRSLGPSPTTLVVGTGDGGSDEELIEAAGEGIWVDQLGYAFPDPLSGAFGGELRMAYRIHRGRLAEPVRGGTVGGTLISGPGEPSMLASVRRLGGRSTLVGSLSAPTMLVEKVAVAGA